MVVNAANNMRLCRTSET